MSDSTFYVTSPIYYVTAAPSIGSAYTTVAADVLARWHRQRGENTWFLTGTDEHGQKVMQAAEANGATPQDFTDKLVAEEWKPVLDVIDASNDDFIRTTDPKHVERVQKFWQTLHDSGDVYEGDFEGPYCVACEEFKIASELLDGEGGVKLCPIHKTPVDLVAERNYFFPLSKYKDKLLAFYEENPTFVQPESARNEVISFVKSDLHDLSISRSTFDWGIEVPWDKDQVLYVWIDALLNYATAVGYGADPDSEDGKIFASRWPASLHLVGRDILRFHAVIWPAMLMAAGVAPPQQVFAHGWLLVGGEKMSKSKANAIHPSEIVDTFGSDAYRYYFMKVIAFGSDGSFSWEHLHAVYTSELANGLGNLVARVTAMVNKYFDGVLPEPAAAGEAEAVVAAALKNAADTANEAIDRIAINEAVSAVADFASIINGYVTEQEPWKVAKDALPSGGAARDRLATILYTAAEALRGVAVLHASTMPKTALALWDALGAEAQLGSLAAQNVNNAGDWGQLRAGAILTKGASLFPRIEITDA